MAHSRVQYEHETEPALTEALAGQMAEQAWAGVFSGGKQIVATNRTKAGVMDLLQFIFDDGSQMNVVGTFEVRYKSPSGDERSLPSRKELAS